MYKIYINDTQIILTNHNTKQLFSINTSEKLIGIYDGKIKTLFRYIDLAEKTNRYSEIILSFPDLDILWTDFKSIFKYITAAGGVVLNEKAEVLSIFRRGMWDLPKGKVDKGEDIKSAAKREVEEETGIKVVELPIPLVSTYHIYKLNKKRILKKTEWFIMNANSGRLTPQIEEDIEEVIWLPPKDLLNKPQIYLNIKYVINVYLQYKNK